MLGRPILNLGILRLRLEQVQVVWIVFLSSIISLFLSPSHLERARYRVIYCLNRPTDHSEISEQCLIKMPWWNVIPEMGMCFL